MNLTPEEIAIYRKEIEISKQFGRKTILAGVSDVEKLLNEVEASRLKISCLKIEPLAETNPFCKP